jgi:hypothetical protein
MNTKEDFIYAAVLSHISWQQIATGPTYRLPELLERVEKATGIKLPDPVMNDVLDRMVAEGFADVIDTGVAGTYIKLRYKPIYDRITSQTQDTKSPAYIYRTIGKRLLVDILGNADPIASDQADTSIPPPILTEDNRARLVVELGSALSKLDDQNVSNEIKAQASSLMSAARSLAEAPEPPVPIIWELITRANALAGIASLLVAIVALFGQ